MDGSRARPGAHTPVGSTGRAVSAFLLPLRPPQAPEPTQARTPSRLPPPKLQPLGLGDTPSRGGVPEEEAAGGPRLSLGPPRPTPSSGPSPASLLLPPPPGPGSALLRCPQCSCPTSALTPHPPPPERCPRGAPCGARLAENHMITFPKATGPACPQGH